MSQKKRRFELEGKIISIIFKDNGNTVHFDYHVNIDVAEESITLELYTRNSINTAVFLLHKTTARNSIEALQLMLAYIRDQHDDRPRYSWTVVWEDALGLETISYFYEKTEEKVREKFYHGHNDYTIKSVTQNPLA